MVVSKKLALGWLFGCLLLSGMAPMASAQYRYRYRPPAVYGGVYAPYAGPGGVLRGQADVINAQGDFMIQSEKARIEREKAAQEQLKTKKEAFQWKQYEKAMTPTFTEEQQKNKKERLHRILTDPIPGEIVSGQAMNELLPYLRGMINHGIQGPPVPLYPSILDKINVVGPSTAGNPGILRDGGQLDWPIVLRGSETQKELAKEIPDAVYKTKNGTIDFKTYKKVRDDIEMLKQEHRKKFHKEEIDGGSFLIGWRFLESLESAVRVLEQPGGEKFINGTYTAKGRNVEELVKNMSSQGLKFARATPGDESAYTSLYGSMVAYTTAAQSSASFQAQIGTTAYPGSIDRYKELEKKRLQE